MKNIRVYVSIVRDRGRQFVRDSRWWYLRIYPSYTVYFTLRGYFFRGGGVTYHHRRGYVKFHYYHRLSDHCAIGSESDAVNTAACDGDEVSIRRSVVDRKSVV